MPLRWRTEVKGGQVVGPCDAGQTGPAPGHQLLHRVRAVHPLDNGY